MLLSKRCNSIDQHQHRRLLGLLHCVLVDGYTAQLVSFGEKWLHDGVSTPREQRKRRNSFAGAVSALFPLFPSVNVVEQALQLIDQHQHRRLLGFLNRLNFHPVSASLLFWNWQRNQWQGNESQPPFRCRSFPCLFQSEEVWDAVGRALPHNPAASFRPLGFLIRRFQVFSEE